MADDDDRPSWLDNAPYLGGEAYEALEQLIEEHDLPHPSTWDAYDVQIGPDEVGITITGPDGTEYDLSQLTDAYDIDDWDWVWELWDWLEENYPDVDKDSKYAEA